MWYVLKSTHISSMPFDMYNIFIVYIVVIYIFHNIFNNNNNDRKDYSGGHVDEGRLIETGRKLKPLLQ